ncbi:PriCT-2 domain-containing protein [Roseateles sp.]|uniref:PriCT-2 domain-containing protein n=1 Tax=Roseateles sp. TaxID=1971397 RepID=UPI00267ADE2B
MLLASDTDRARDALQHIPADLPRDEWVCVLMAAQAAGLDADTVNDWSAQAGNYDERAFRDTWRSIKPGKGVGAGTLFKKAAEHGSYGKRRERPIQAPERSRKAAEPPR